MADQPRQYDDDEVSLILRRASELQEAHPTGAAGGMTLADLEAIAREAGLDPALVRQAAAELPARDAAPALPAARFLGAPTALRFERVVDGELPPAAYDVLVDEVRRAMNDVGTVSTLGRTLAWSTSSSRRPGHATGRHVQVTVTARDGRTMIRVEETATALAAGLFGGIVGGVGGGGAGAAVALGVVLHSALAALGIWGALAGWSYLLARTIFTDVVRRRAAGLSALAERLAALVADAQNGRSSSA